MTPDEHGSAARNSIAGQPYQPYQACYRLAGDTEVTRHASSSWWQAREWMIDQTSYDYRRQVDIEIAWDNPSAGVQRPLMTAHLADSEQIRAELRCLDTLMGGRRELDGKPFIDELHAEVMLQDYRDARLDQHNPHYRVFTAELHADDLRDQLLDFSSRTGLGPTTADIDDVDTWVAAKDLSDEYFVRGNWLYDVAFKTEMAMENHQQHGVRVEYPVIGETDCVIRAGRDHVDTHNPWYAEKHHRTRREGTVDTRITPLGRYQSCDELLAVLHHHASDPSRETHDTIPARDVAHLRSFDEWRQALRDDYRRAKNLYTEISEGRPYIFEASHCSATTTLSRKNSGPPQYTLTRGDTEPTPGQPNPAVSKDPRTERSQRRRQLNRQPRSPSQHRHL